MSEIEQLRVDIAEVVGKSDLPLPAKNLIRSRLFGLEGNNLLHGTTIVDNQKMQRHPPLQDGLPFAPEKKARREWDYGRELIYQFLIATKAETILGNQEPKCYGTEDIAKFTGWIQEHGSSKFEVGVRHLTKRPGGKWIKDLQDESKATNFGPINTMASNLGLTRPIPLSEAHTSYVLVKNPENQDRVEQLRRYARGDTTSLPARKR